MNKIPPAFREPFIKDLPLHYCGKVGEVYDLGDPKHKLILRTDRISAFDFVFPCFVPGKGIVLNQVSVWRKRQLMQNGFQTDLVAFGNQIDDFLPPNLRKNPEIQNRSMVVHWYDNRLSVEAIVRGRLLGSAVTRYINNPNDVFGYKLPPNMQKGSKLSPPLFTPTTKEEDGHDLPISRQVCANRFGEEVEEISLRAFNLLSSLTPADIILADTKFEFVRDKGGLIFCDEVGTLDSSRYLDIHKLEEALRLGREPEPMDKEYFRGAVAFAKELDPSMLEDIQKVWRFVVPCKVIESTSKLYQDVSARLMS